MHDTKKKKTFLQRKCALVFVCSHNYNYTIYEEFQIKKSNFKAKVSFAILLVKINVKQFQKHYETAILQ